jgi:hypothetical protein
MLVPSGKVIVEGRQDSSRSFSYELNKQKLIESLSEESLDPKLKSEIQKLLKDISSIVSSHEEGITLDIATAEEIEQLLKSDYQKLGLSYENAQAEIDGILSKDAVDPEIIALNKKIMEEEKNED